jgi:hypothetical protein
MGVMKELIRFTFRMEMELMKIPGLLFFSEFVGTAFLIGVGLSIIIIDFSPDSPVVALLPSAGLRRFLTGFLFGTTGGLIALSPVGKISGAHINPVVTTAFWLRKKIGAGHALGYIEPFRCFSGEEQERLSTTVQPFRVGNTSPGRRRSARSQRPLHSSPCCSSFSAINPYASSRPSFFPFSMPSWSILRLPFPGRAPIPRAAWDRK